jgi:hypothetical protein
MKLFKSTLPLTSVMVFLVMVTACKLEREPSITVGVDGCTECGMVIDQEREACIYEVDRVSFTFCSPGCLLKSFEKRRKEGRRPPDPIFFADYETGELVPHETMTFLLTDHRPTTMGWGILAFADPEQAEAHRQFDDETFVDWVGLRTLRGEPDQRLSLVLGPGGFEPPVVLVEKGELVEWVLESRGLEEDQKIVLRGYREFGEVVIPAAGPPVRARLLASRPGEGFVLESVPDGEVLGQLRVKGPHTPDEEEM